jgi:hypothetical protein
VAATGLAQGPAVVVGKEAIGRIGQAPPQQLPELSQAEAIAVIAPH